MSKKFSYDKSITELNQIVANIESGEVGLDELGSMVKKANELINKCRDKLRTIESEVRNLSEDK